MIIKNMFSKPIDRDIKGVIKVGQDDDANIKQELEEYVVTRELQKHFSSSCLIFASSSCPTLIFLISSQATKEELSEIRTRWACGFPASLEVVNLTS